MLYHLRVKNLALIDSAEVEFGDGLNILTGETGAGKSIIIGSVQIALGGKAPKEMIRRGCDSAYIELVFSIDDERKREQLKEHDVYPDEEGILIISKKITPTRSISRINDETVTAARLREITGLLIDLHGQHEHQSLVNASKHLEILDAYGGEKLLPFKQNTEAAYRLYMQLKQKCAAFASDQETRLREMDFCRFEIEEIENAALKDGEEEKVAADFKRFSNARRIAESLSQAYDAVSGGELSRIMLAIKTVLAETDQVPTLIFDEIDTGISGRTAQMVSEKLRILSKCRQVICITHLPQIAAMADQHFEIRKSASDGRTATSIRALDREAMVDELARLLGGAEITETVRQNAEEMKKLAKKRKLEV